MRLSPTDFDLLDGAVLELHQPRKPAALKAALAGILLHLIPADCFFVLEYELSPALDSARFLARQDPEQRITPEMIRYTEGAFFVHPFSQYLARTGDLAPLKISDFYNRHQFRNTEIYQNFYKDLEADGLIATVLMAPGPRQVGCLNLARRRDFSERDRLLLTLLRPHIGLARRNAEWEAACQSADPPAPPLDRLTPPEARVARWLAAGKTDPEIAIILQENARTVERRVSRILKKLGAKNRTTAAVMLAHRQPRHDAGVAPSRLSLPAARGPGACAASKEFPHAILSESV